MRFSSPAILETKVDVQKSQGKKVLQFLIESLISLINFYFPETDN